MANTKFSQFNSATTLTGSEYFVGLQSGNNTKFLLSSDILPYLNSNTQLGSVMQVTGLPATLATFVDLSSNQTIGGNKTFTNPISADIGGIAVKANTLSTSQSTSSATFYVAFFPSSSNGYQQIQLATNLTYVPSSGLLSVTNLNLSGLTLTNSLVGTDGSKNITTSLQNASATLGTLSLVNNSSALVGNQTVMTFGSALSYGNYIQFGGLGSYLGIENANNGLFIGGNLLYNSTSNVYDYANTGTAALFLINSSGIQLCHAVSGTSGNPATPVVDLSIDASGNINLPNLTASLPVFTDGSKNLTNTGTVPFSKGGFGFSTATTGDLFLATGTNTPGKLSDVATGSVLGSGGVGVAPSWLSSPTLTGLTLASAANLTLTANLTNTLTITSSSGVGNIASLVLNRNDSTNGSCLITLEDAGTKQWSWGSRPGSGNFVLYDEVNSQVQFSVSHGTGINVPASFTGSLNIGNVLTLITASASSIVLPNGGAIAGKNSGATIETWCYPRFTDNKTYMDIGSAGATFRQNSAGATWMSVDTSSNVTFNTGNVLLGTAGKTLTLKTGVNAASGTVTLSGTTTTVNTSTATTGDLILLTVSAPGGTQGFLSYSISNGVSFTITSTLGATDTSTIKWAIIHQN